MPKDTESRTGGHILADQLRVQGVDTVFCVPGESHLAVLDGLYNHRNAIKVITARHEAGAANMADAYGKLTGRPGICLVTRGPGATNASNGVHTAFQDSTPMIVLIGQVARNMVDREAFQEMDYRRMFGEMAKWVAQIDDAARIPEYMSRAFHEATSGRPGPVVLALPEDMLVERATVADAQPAKPVQASPSTAAMSELRERLAAAKRPLMIVGGPTWTTGAIADITTFAEANRLPVAASLRSQDCFDNRHDHYIGDVGIAINPKLSARIKASDLLIVAGPRLGEMTTQGYSLIDIPNPAQAMVHIHPGVGEIGRVYSPELGINAGMGEFAAAAAALEAADSSAWQATVPEARAEYLAHIQPTEVPGDVNFGKVMAHLSEVLPEDAVISNGAGNYTVWVHRFFQHKAYRTQLAPTSGSMGYSVPAAVAAKITEPERTVVSFNGDGCFMMLGQEMATAAQYGANVIFIIANNRMLGTIRMHQERNYPERVIATELVNPDFVLLAKAYGGHGEQVTKTEDFPAAFERAQASGKPALIELVLDPEALTPKQTLSDIQEASRK
ncbi:MAG: thiamine pyrophosphate-binding protein [Rhodospirillales bacterium]|nr:thiamine pyrophosphate-binding protein [Rhodospirillales bacterium]